MPQITINSLYRPFPNGWFSIVLPTLFWFAYVCMMLLSVFFEGHCLQVHPLDPFATLRKTIKNLGVRVLSAVGLVVMIMMKKMMMMSRKPSQNSHAAGLCRFHIRYHGINKADPVQTCWLYACSAGKKRAERSVTPMGSLWCGWDIFNDAGSPRIVILWGWSVLVDQEPWHGNLAGDQ